MTTFTTKHGTVVLSMSRKVYFILSILSWHLPQVTAKAGA